MTTIATYGSAVHAGA